MNPEDADVIPYLANIILVISADGARAPKEAEALERIRGEIGAKKGDLNKAIKLVEGRIHKLTKVGRWSIQISNLEDMLFVALVDGELKDAESSVLTEFAEKLGINQPQLDLMQAEAERRISVVTDKKCVGCSAKIPAEAKFCPHCGAAAILAAPPVSPAAEYIIPKTGTAIEFSESSSGSFDAILICAKKSPNFSSCLKGTKCWYLAAWPDGDFTETLELGALLSGLKNKKLFMDGTERSWDEVYGFSWCAAERSKAFKPVEYCFGKDDNRLNPFGCKQVRMEWSDWAQWFSYGKFRKDGITGKKLVWVFDKERIKHEAHQNVNRFRFCPHIRLKLIDAVIAALPVEINPSQNPGWEFKHAYNDIPGAEKIVEIERQSGMEWKNEYMVFGVQPKGLVALKAIWEEAFLLAGIRDVKVSDLLK